MQKLFIKQTGDTMQYGGASKHWLYRGQKPGLIAKFLNRVIANNASKEGMNNGLVVLEVISRKSGRVISFLLVMIRVDEQRYLASMLGESQWVSNVRAAGGKAVLRSGGYEEVQLTEMPVGERAPILKAYLNAAPGARPHVAVDGCANRRVRESRGRLPGLSSDLKVDKRYREQREEPQDSLLSKVKDRFATRVTTYGNTFATTKQKELLMQRSKNFVKGTALWKIDKVGLAIAVI